MAVLITGAAGFIGMHVAVRLLERQYHVIGIDNLNPYYSPRLKRDRLDEIKRLSGDAFEFLQIDFSHWEELECKLKQFQIDRIVHLGAQPGVRYSLENPFAYVQSNLVGHAHLLEFAKRRRVSHFVYASSSSVYGANDNLPFSAEDRVDRPVSLYAATKRSDELLSEAYAHLFRLPMTGLRFFTVYGPWGRPDMAPWRFTQAVLDGEPILVFNNGHMKRDFTYIEDIVRGVIACLDAPPEDDGKRKPGGSLSPHNLYNIGNSQAVELMRFIEVVESACQRKAILNFQPMQPGDVVATCADIEPIRRLHGFEPATTIDEGIPHFVDWYRKYHAR